MSSSNCCFLICIQISLGQVFWYSHHLKNFPQFVVIHTVKGFGIVNKAEVDGFLELSCFSDDPTAVGNLISGSSAFSKSSLNIWKFPVHILLKSGLQNFEHYFASVWNECSCAVVWTFFGIAFLCDSLALPHNAPNIAPDLPVSVQASPVEAWVDGRLLQGRRHWVWQRVLGTFWRRLPLSSLPPHMLAK